MKTKHFVAIVALCSAVAGGNLFAETTTPAPDQKGKNRDLISKETREKLRSAREEAMKDPNVVALEKQKEYLDQQYRDAVRAAMIKNDPSLQPVLDQLPDKPMRGRFGHGAKDGKRFGDGKRGKNLPPELKEKMEQVKDDPAVKAAHDKMEAAQGKEEKKAAWMELTAARKAALEKIDPDLAKRIEQFHKGKPGQ